VGSTELHRYECSLTLSEAEAMPAVPGPKIHSTKSRAQTTATHGSEDTPAKYHNTNFQKAGSKITSHGSSSGTTAVIAATEEASIEGCT